MPEQLLRCLIHFWCLPGPTATSMELLRHNLVYWILTSYRCKGHLYEPLTNMSDLSVRALPNDILWLFSLVVVSFILLYLSSLELLNICSIIIRHFDIHCTRSQNVSGIIDTSYRNEQFFI